MLYDSTVYHNVGRIQLADLGGFNTIIVREIGSQRPYIVIAEITTGSETDDVTVRGLVPNVKTGSSDDYIWLEGCAGGVADGERGNDRIVLREGVWSHTNVSGGDGDDDLDAGGNYYSTWLDGGAGRDTITGSLFDDNIWGGPGFDIIDGYYGNDGINSQDGEQDYVDGGGGRDALLRDDVELAVFNVEDERT